MNELRICHLSIFPVFCSGAFAVNKTKLFSATALDHAHEGCKATVGVIEVL